MIQALVPSTISSGRAPRHRLTWVSPGEDLWVASRMDGDGVHYLGFVERSLGEFIAVDGAGASRGRHGDLASAKAAVELACAPEAAGAWSETGARVLTVRALRSR